MEIKFYTNLIALSENIKRATNIFFHNAIIEMKLEISEFEKIIIADNEFLYKAVNEIKPNSSFTNDEHLIIGGKSFLIDSNNGYKFSLLFNSLNFAGALVDIPPNSDKAMYTLQKHSNALVFHELAHCLDNKLRAMGKNYNIRNDDRLFKIKTVANYYISILIDEIAACYLSASKIDSDVFHYEMDSNNESFKKLLEEKSTLCTNYSGNPDELYEMAFKIAGTFWFIFIQCGKLIGWKIGNESLENLKIEFPSINNHKSNKILRKFEILINKFWLGYPNINANNIFDDLLSLWKSFTLSIGIKFTESENGDGIFW